MGKGDKNRDIIGWMSKDITKKLKKIFRPKKKKEKKSK